MFKPEGYDALTGEWNDSLLGEFLWSSVNVSEAVPDVMTPVTWSLWWIYHYEANPIKFPGEFPFCGNLCGRPYLNLSLLASVLRAVGKDFRKELQGDMIGSASADIDIPLIKFSPLAVLWKVLPGMLEAQRKARWDHKQMPVFLAMMPDWCRAWRATIQNCPDAAGLFSLWTHSIKPGVVQACSQLRSVTLSMADPATKLRLDLNNLIGESDAHAILSNLSGGSAELESLGPVLGLAQVVNGKMTPEAYRERYGHRGAHEMELFAPGSEEDPDWLEKRLAEFGRPSTDVDTLLQKQRDEWTTAWQRFESHHPEKAASVQRQLQIVTTAARNREAVRSEVTRLARLVRQYILRCGEITGLGEGIFFLSLDEITAVLSGERACMDFIPARRKAYTLYVSLPPYPAILVGAFDPIRWASDPQRRSDYYDSRTRNEAASPTMIKGYAGAAGCVEGIVRRIDNPEEGKSLQPGEILVTVTTNIGWTPLFPRLAAIVTDVGAPLSHAAIVARELGIPAVVGCGNATTWLKTGDRVRVDGSRGVVELLENGNR